MKPKYLLRIAAILMIVHLSGHAVGTLGWKNTPIVAKQEVIRHMMSAKFPFMGADRSMGDYYEGYGWACSIAMIFFAAVLWFAADESKEARSLVLKITATLCVCLAAWSATEFLFFFPFAAGTTLLSAVFTGIAWKQLRSDQTE